MLVIEDRYEGSITVDSIFERLMERRTHKASQSPRIRYGQYNFSYSWGFSFAGNYSSKKLKRLREGLFCEMRLLLFFGSCSVNPKAVVPSALNLLYSDLRYSIAM